MRLEVIVHRATGASHAMPLVGQISIGRGPENDIVIPDLRVSWKHALVFASDDGKVMVKDLGSSNGTQVNGRDVADVTAWEVGARLRVGDVELTLGSADSHDGPLPSRSMAVEDVETGVRYPLRRPHVRIGNTPDADLRIAGGECNVTLISHDDGEVWLGVDDEDRPLKEGETFEVCGVRLRLVEADADWLPTATDDDNSHPYQIDVGFDPGPYARITDENTGTTHTLTAWNRVSLLFFLAAARAEEGDRPAVERGWRTNGSVQVAVWGKAEGQDPRKLKALIHNVRSELRGAGLDPWCVEKRRGYLRLRVRKTNVQP